MICSVDGCTKPVKASGLCAMHKERLRVHGDVMANVPPRHSWRKTDTLQERLERFIDRSGDCWLWTGGCNDAGYGQMAYRGRFDYTHRLMYELHVGPIPEGRELDHLCRQPRCCRPDHLEPVTHKVNQHRGMSPPGQNARKTHCIRGHEFTPENTYMPPGREGRQCRECIRIRWRKAS